MAWRFLAYSLVIDGVLDNRTRGKIKGWIQFKGIKDPVIMDLDGNFQDEAKGKVLVMKDFPTDAGWPEGNVCAKTPEKEMERFARTQKGWAGKLNSYYIQWYGDVNGRCVIELRPHQITILE